MKANIEPTTKRRPGSREEAVFLDLLRTCDVLSRRLAQRLKTEDLSATQYNVLRCADRRKASRAVKLPAA
jgi:hypothetical protein